MCEFLKEFFAERKIEYFSVLSFDDMRVTGEEIMARESFTPRSVIIYLLPYYTGETGNLSRYAASLDYHLAIREVNEGLEAVLKAHFPTCSLRGYGDHSPIDERYAALIGGLGVAGDNGLLINEKYGSYVFVGDVICDLPPEIFEPMPPTRILRCEGCGACRAACPTGILRGEGCDCLSAITQRKGALTDDERRLMREYGTLWGCDVCQSVCPHNDNPVMTPIEFFYRERIESLTPELLMRMDKATLRERAFGWRGKTVLERNLEVLFSENAEK